MAVVGEAHIIVRAITGSVKNDIQRAFDGADRFGERAGRDAGQSFNRGFRRGGGGGGLFDDLGREADNTYKKLVKLINIGYFMGPALAGAASAVSSLVSSLFALAAQAAMAGPALIGLLDAFSALAQGAIVLKLAFSGVGKALTAGLNDKGAAKATAAAVDNARRIRDARRRLAEAIEQAAETEERVQKNVARAWRNYQDSVINTQKAVNNLKKAQKDAAEATQQLGFDVEDAALAQERAGQALEDARRQLQAASSLPPDNRTRKDAELAFKEADLAYRRAVDRNNDLKQTQEQAAAAGSAGAEDVVSAAEDVNQAKRDEADAYEAYKDTVVDAERARRDSARAITQAEEALAEALKNADKAGRKGASGLSAFDRAMAKLSKEAQHFVRYLLSIQGEIKKLRAAAGRKLFPQLEVAIQTLIDKLFPELIPLLENTGDVLGKVAIRISNVITSADNLRNIKSIWKSNDVVLATFGETLGYVLDIVLDLMDAATPLAVKFAKWLNSVVKGWRDIIQLKKETGELRDIMLYSGGVAAQLGRIFGNLGRAIFGMGKAAAGPGSGGQMLMDALEGATKKFEIFVETVRKNGSLAQFFRDSATNTISMGRALVRVVDGFLRLGNNKGVSKFFDTISKKGGAVDSFFSAFEKLSDSTVAVQLGEIVNNLAKIFDLLTETHSLQIFFGILQKASEVALKFFSNKTVLAVFGFMVAIHAVTRAFGLLFSITRIGFLYLLGSIRSVIKGMTFLFGRMAWGVAMMRGFGSAAAATAGSEGLAGLASALTIGLGPLIAIVAAIAAVIAVLVGAYTQSEIFRESLSNLATVVGDTLVKAWESLKKAFNDAFDWMSGDGTSAVDGFLGVLKSIGDVLGTYVVPFIRDVLVFDIQYIAGVIGTVIRIIGGVIQSIVSFYQGMYEGAKPYIDEIIALWKENFQPIVETVVSWFQTSVGPGLSDVFDKIGTAISTFWDLAQPVFRFLGQVAGAMIGSGLLGTFKLVIIILKGVGAVLVWLWETVLQPVFKWIGDFTSNTVVPAFQSIGQAVQSLVDFVRPLFDALGSLFGSSGEDASTASGGVAESVGGISSAFQGVVDFIRPLIDTFTGIFDTMGKTLGAIFSSITQAFQGVADAFSPITNLITGIFTTAFLFIRSVVQIIIGIFQVLGFGFRLLWEGIQQYWNTTVVPIFNGIRAFIRALTDTIGKYWNDYVVQPFRNAWKVVEQWWNGTVIPLFIRIQTYVRTGLAIIGALWNQYVVQPFQNAWNVVMQVWNGTVVPFFERVKSYLQLGLAIIAALWDQYVVKPFHNAWNSVMDWWNNTVAPFFTSLGELIGGIARNVWGRLTDGLNEAISKIKGFVNGLIDAWNGIIDAFNRIPGHDPVDRLPPLMATGGVVRPVTGGKLVRVAEAGRAERIEPLDSSGLSKRDRAMIQMLAGGSGGGGGQITVNVHPSAGMDERELAAQVSRQIRLQMRKGAA